jgi:hypothetical protein
MISSIVMTSSDALPAVPRIPFDIGIITPRVTGRNNPVEKKSRGRIGQATARGSGHYGRSSSSCDACRYAAGLGSLRSAFGYVRP